MLYYLLWDFQLSCNNWTLSTFTLLHLSIINLKRVYNRRFNQKQARQTCQRQCSLQTKSRAKSKCKYRVSLLRRILQIKIQKKIILRLDMWSTLIELWPLEDRIFEIAPEERTASTGFRFRIFSRKYFSILW